MITRNLLYLLIFLTSCFSSLASVALLAHSRRVPVIVAAESFKFSERIQLDAIVHNELGSIEELIEVPNSSSVDSVQTRTRDVGYKGVESSGSTKKDNPFEVINLRYDLTPARLLSMIATETGLIPPTSIPVLLRELRNDALRGK